MTRTKQCDSPAPSNGGDPCDGNGSETATCNNPPCEGRVEIDITPDIYKTE